MEKEMKNKIFISIFLIMTLFIFAKTPGNNISTTLIIIEETENEFVAYKNITPFSDGVFNAMWETPFIFFDMQIDSPIPIFGANPDIRLYLEDARKSGADSILIIKCCYETTEIDGKLNMKTNDIPYILYSIRDMKVLKSGSKKTNIKKQVETNGKNKILKDLGSDVVSDIFG